MNHAPLANYVLEMLFVKVVYAVAGWVKSNLVINVLKEVFLMNHVMQDKCAWVARNVMVSHASALLEL